ncbi:ABC transporter substrate-binding protein [Kribbella albertanoniae]|nr:extracellular solute-binding protein [Kribbella albertanoniae]
MGRRGIAAMVVAAALLATGCSGQDDSGQQQQAAGPASLTFWTWAPNMDKVVALWNQQNPDIKVTVNKQDGGDPAVTKLLTATKAGSGAPDVMQAEYQKIPTLVAADALADISKNLDPSVAKAFPEAVWNSVSLGSDAVYAVPQDTGPMVFYYREDVFKSLGLQAPKTWADYAAAARKVHQSDPKKYLGTFSAADAGWFSGLAQQAGASWWGVNGQSWSVDIDSDATRKVADFWGGLVEEGVIGNKPMYTPAWNAGLNNGTQVGWVSAVWGPGVLEANAAKTVGKWKMAPLPQWDAAKEATGNWGGSATAVTSQSKHQAQAAKFSAWLNTDPEAVKALAQISGVYPAATAGQTEALTSPPKFFANQPDFYQTVAKAATTVAPFTYGPNVNVAYNTYNDAFGKAADAKKKSAFLTALTTMQASTVKDLTDSGFTVAK